MFVNFIGAPCSGKTTVAAGVFSRLKKYGLATEYVSEFARHYIATKRFRKQSTKLDNLDQLKIMEGQLLEEVLFGQDKSVIVVTDTSPLNSLLYLEKPLTIEDKIYEEVMFHKSMNREDTIYFYCGIVPLPTIVDPNRIHDQMQIAELDTKAIQLIDRVKNNNPNVNLHWLTENVDDRIDIATGLVLRENIKLC